MKNDNSMTLADTISLVAAKVGSLEADKKHAMGYPYISSERVLEVGGDAMAEYGLVVMPETVSARLEVYQSAKGGNIYVMFLTQKMNVFDRYGNEKVVMWESAGSDTQTPDKALFKAITSGYKYFLMKLLNISIGQPDGEHDDDGAKRMAETAVKFAKSRADFDAVISGAMSKATAPDTVATDEEVLALRTTFTRVFKEDNSSKVRLIKYAFKKKVPAELTSREVAALLLLFSEENAVSASVKTFAMYAE